MRATNDTACPSGSQARPRPEAAIPRSSAGDTAGNAARFAAMVTPGTSWKWNRSSGVTPSCAAVVVPKAKATGTGSSRPSRSASGVASVTMPAVAATDSWNPIACTSHGSRTSSASTAVARIVPVARGLPSRMPVRASEAIAPARSTEGSAPVSTTKSTTTPRPIPKRVSAPTRKAPAKATTGANTIATFSPETTNRCPRPVVWKSRVVTESSFEASPRTRPSSNPASRGGKIRSIVRPTNARTTWVSRMNGAGAPPTRSTSKARTLTARPRCDSDCANPASSGICRVPSMRS